MRGNQDPRTETPTPPGSIPACAGEPTFVTRYAPLYSALGLSPRVRGNHRLDAGSVGVSGSIPACAGEPGAHRPGKEHNAVYPRVCGGTSTRAGRCKAIQGLSPRVRGNLLRSKVNAGAGDGGLSPRVRGNQKAQTDIVNRAGRRSIPACAGEPRNGVAAIIAAISGLSPRVRGNPDADETTTL